MQSLPVLSSKIGDLAFPLIELTKCHRIAIECRKAAAVFEDRIRDEVGIYPASRRKFFGGRVAGQLFEQGSRPPVIRHILLERCRSKNLFRVVQAAMRN